MNVWQLILDAFLKQLEAHPDEVFALIQRIVGLFEKHPEAVTAAINLIPKKTP